MHGVCKCKAEIQRWHPMPSIAYFFLHTHQASGEPRALGGCLYRAEEKID